MFARLLQQWLIRRIRRVQSDYVRDRQSPFVAPEPFDSVPGTYLALSFDGEVEPTAATLEEAFDYVGSAEADG